MAEVTLKPDPQSWPPGTVVKVYPRPVPEAGGRLEGKPSGVLLGEFTVGSTGSLTITGITLGERYVGWINAGGFDRYLFFGESSSGSSTGLTKAEVEAVAAAKVATETTRAESAESEAVKLTGSQTVAGAKTFSSSPLVPTPTEAAQAATKGYSDTEKARAEAAEALKAPLAAPALTGVPTTPTAAPGTNTTQIASTAFVAVSFAPLASPALTGAPTAPTAAGGTNTTQIATTAFVATSFAPLASAALTGTPTSPTAAAKTNTTQVATTAFVQTARAEAETASRPAGTKVVTNTPHAWVIPGATSAETLPGPVVVPATGETLKVVRIDYKIREGTKATFKLQKNGVDITGFTALEAKTEAKHVTPTAVTLAEGEEITLVITAVEGSPKGFSATIQLEHSAS